MRARSSPTEGEELLKAADAKVCAFAVGSAVCSESLGDRLLHAQATIPGPGALKCGAKDKKCDTLWHAHRTHEVCFVLFI